MGAVMTAVELEAMLLQSPVGFALLRGRDLVFELVNAPYAQMAGRPREAMVGRRYRDLFPELAGTGTFELLERIVDTGEPVVMREYRLELVRDGERRPAVFDFSARPTRDAAGAVTGVMGVAVDVTEAVTRREQAEALATRLAASEELFRGAQETSLDAFLALRSVRDAQGRVVDFDILFQNAAGVRINGVDVRRTGPRRMLEAFPGLVDLELWQRYVHTAQTGEPFQLETPYQTDGLDGWYRVLCSRVGEGIAVSFSDITEKKRAERAGREAREHAEALAAAVEEQCREMDAAMLRAHAERDAARAERDAARAERDALRARLEALERARAG
jgi:PAS domain S-box-containing protein